MKRIILNEYVLCNTLRKNFCGVMFKKYFVPHVFEKPKSFNNFRMHSYFCIELDFVVLNYRDEVIQLLPRAISFKKFCFNGKKVIEFMPGEIKSLNIQLGDKIILK